MLPNDKNGHLIGYHNIVTVTATVAEINGEQLTLQLADGATITVTANQTEWKSGKPISPP